MRVSPLVTLLAAAVAVAVAVAGLSYAQEAPRTTPIGYPSVAAALANLEAEPGAHVSEHDGWTIVSVRNGDERSVWSFTRSGHPAHPAAAKRTVYEQDGSVMMRTNALCEASKKECDNLMQQFVELEQKIREQIQLGDSGT